MRARATTEQHPGKELAVDTVHILGVTGQILWFRSMPVRPRSSRKAGRTNSIAPFTSSISAIPTCAVGAKLTGTSWFLSPRHNHGDQPGTSAILEKPISWDGLHS
jgi:hypothetical protein